MPPKPKSNGNGNGGDGGGAIPDAIQIDDLEADLKEPYIVPKPPPLPRPPRLQVETMPLVDIPCVYLNDRSCWSDQTCTYRMRTYLELI